MSLLYTSMASGELIYIIYRHLCAIAVYINGEWTDPLYYIPNLFHFCKYQWRVESSSILYTDISVPLLYMSVVSGELLYIIYRHLGVIAVYISGEWTDPLYYVPKSLCHCCIYQKYTARGGLIHNIYTEN